ncbi:Ig-like domain repeat protein [Nakamurella silvestris]|nr:Ig-like domain repeat protein [Nakamurella silvestris]
MTRSIPEPQESGYRSSRITALAGSVVLAATLLTGVTAGTAAAQQPTSAITVSQAEFSWAVNDESGGGAFFGGCNFLSAGKAGDTGSSRLWSKADGLYQTEVGNTRIEKLTATGGYQTPTWETKCQDANGKPVKVTTNDSTTGNRVVIAAGAGTIDPVANTAAITWDGSFTVTFYGGLTYWSVSNPALVVRADGSGEVTAVASGFGADMADPSLWVPLTPRTITLATLTGARVTAGGLTVQPDYLGVAVNPGTSAPQPARTPDDTSYWGSFPQSFVDYQLQTGQAAYWYTSGGARDKAKPAKPITVTVPTDQNPVVAPLISAGPVSTSVTAAGRYTFSVTASGDGLIYRWERRAAGSSIWTPVTGATAATLSGTATSVAAGGAAFRVVVSNAGGNVTSGAAALTVTRAKPTLTFALPSTVVHGRKATATVTVTAPAGLARTGAVTITSGAAVLGRGTLSGGKATIALPSTLTAGKRAITASYAGSVDLTTATASRSLTVTKAVSTVKVKVAKTTVKAGTRAKLTVSVAAAGVVPTGKVVIKAGAAGRTTVASVVLTAKHTGIVTVTLPVLAKGKHKITAAYAGTASIAARTSAALTLTVTAR